MSWSTIWELIKINILYSNPQTLSQIKKKREKNPGKPVIAYKSMLRQQAFLNLLFLVLYLPMLLLVDFKAYPGLFTRYVMVFFIMALCNNFSALYTIFYDSSDLALYAPLPVKTSEVYLAKLFSSFGMGAMFLLPILDALMVAYWKILGPLGVLLALVMFVVVVVSCLSLSLTINHLIGRLVVRSKRRKLFSTILMVVTTGLTLLAILMMSQVSTDDKVVRNVPLYPYFRGFYDIVMHPFSLEAVLNFYVPLLIVLLLVVLLIKRLVPNYYQDAFYANKSKQASVRRKTPKNRSLRGLMIRHHLSTLQNASLIIQAYLFPLLYPLIFIGPLVATLKGRLGHVDASYFGLVFLIGSVLGVLTASSTSYAAVGLSLEKENYSIFKALPINFRSFVKQKYLVLSVAQLSVPFVFYAVIAVVVGLHPLNTLGFLLGFCLSGLVMGQFMYYRDYRLLVLNWQDITQLYNRGAGQWVSLAILVGSLFIGGIFIALEIILGVFIGQAVAGLAFALLVLVALVLLQLLLSRLFWKKLD